MRMLCDNEGQPAGHSSSNDSLSASTNQPSEPAQTSPALATTAASAHAASQQLLAGNSKQRAVAASSQDSTIDAKNQQQQLHFNQQHEIDTMSTTNNNIATNNNTNAINNSNTANAPTYHGSRSATHIGRKPAFGQTCSMKTLLQDGILQAGEKVLTLEVEGSKFCGDLRRDGTIMMRSPGEAPHIYATPVAWANHCCKMLNPESKPLNAWSSIRFKGKRLDSYKLKWYRAQKKPPNSSINSGVSMNLNDNMNGASSIIRNLHNLQNNNNLQNHQQNIDNQQANSRLMIHNPITNCFPQYENPLKNKKLIKSILISNNMDIDCRKLVAKSLDLSEDPTRPAIQNNNNNNNNTNNLTNNDNNNNNQSDSHIATVISYEQLGTRGPHNTHNPNTMVKCIPFGLVERIQPFNVNVSTNALLLIDFHSHLVEGEVAGYLAGSWDLGSHVLTVTQAFPCRTILNNESLALATEEEIRQDIEKRQMTVVGWYHSHQGKYSNHPTIRDIQNHMEHQITMKDSASGYTPCIGLICSPHDTRSDDDLSPSFQIYWVMPPPEHLANHYGRPMQMYYSVNRDLFLTQDLLLEMRLLANYYNTIPEMVDFKSRYQHNDRITNLDKLSGSIKPKLPKDLQESEYPDEPAIWKAAVDHFWKFLKNLVIPTSEPAQEQRDDDRQVDYRMEEQKDVDDETASNNEDDQNQGVVQDKEVLALQDKEPHDEMLERDKKFQSDQDIQQTDDDQQPESDGIHPDGESCNHVSDVEGIEHFE